MKFMSRMTKSTWLDWHFFQCSSLLSIKQKWIWLAGSSLQMLLVLQQLQGEGLLLMHSVVQCERTAMS